MVQPDYSPPQIMDEYSSNCYHAFQKFYSEDLDNVNDLSPNHLYLQIPEVERDFFILNKDMGSLIDIRTLEQDSPIRFDVNKAWGNYWEHCQKLSDELLQTVQLGDTFKVIALFETVKRAFYLNVNLRDLDEWTPLHFACNQSNVEIVEILLEKGAKVNLQTAQQRTAMHYCALRNNIVIAKLLIKYQADLDIQDIEHNTALHLASMYGNAEFCQLLLENNAKADLKNQYQQLAVECCQNQQELDIFQQFHIELDQSHYTRTPIEGTNLIIPNGRSDHIQRLLFTLQRNQTVRHAEHQEQQMEDIVDAMQNRQTTWDKVVNFALEFTRISIFQSKKDEVSRESLNTTTEDKIGPSSFIYYQKLGAGGFGEVFLVEKIGQIPPKPYAMKVMKKESMESSNIITTAQTEKDVLKIMNHPFIVKLNYAFQTSKHLYLVMDLCPGGDLAQHLLLLNRISEPVVKIYAAEIVLAIEALHKNGIIFRDLKPDNIVIDADGHALLTDFGLSKQGVDEEMNNQSFCGTLSYLAPEMLLKKGYGRQVDWYMLGILIYELLVGVSPYHDNEKEILKDNILKAPLRIPKFISPEAKDIIIKLLLRDPKKRLGSVRDGKDIRHHPWFADINWKMCYNRQLQPPKPLLQNSARESIRVKFSNENHKNKIDQWTFIDES